MGKNKYLKWGIKLELRGIQSTIMAVFSLISFSVLLILGFTIYTRFSASARQEIISGTDRKSVV